MATLDLKKTIKNLTIPNQWTPFKKGIAAGIPIAIGYIPIAIAFGVLAKSLEVPNYVSLLMSLIVFAGASQFVGVNLIAIGASHWEILLTTFILNFRHFLMTASISQRLEKHISKKMMSLLSFGVTDETFMVASMKHHSLKPGYLLGLNFTAYLSWNVGTWIGIFLGEGIPASFQASMGVALYAMFIGLLIPAIKKSRPFLVAAIFAVTVHSILHWVPLTASLSTGWSVIITIILTSAIAAILFPEGEEPL